MVEYLFTCVIKMHFDVKLLDFWFYRLALRKHRVHVEHYGNLIQAHSELFSCEYQACLCQIATTSVGLYVLRE